MTFEQKALEMLESNGMFPDQARAVLAMMKTDPANEVIKERWGHDIAGYGDIMINVLWANAKYNALRYIDENIPRAWFRPLFTPSPEAELERLKQETV